MRIRELEQAYLRSEYDLLSWLKANRATEFGREYDFGAIRSIEDYQSAVPMADYACFDPWIRRAAEGEPAVLTSEPVLGFETTSGSSGGEKWIPFTETFRTELANALLQWFRVWSIKCPSVLEGPAYWSVSPALQESRHTPGGHPLGFTNDAAYFPADVAMMLGDWLVTSPSLPSEDGDAFYAATIDALLEYPDLRLVSVWSPTFFLRLDEALRDRVGERTWNEIWPELALVSCWTEAASALWIDDVRLRAGDISIEGKGLAATEGVTSIPSVNGAPTLAKGVHFHEFIGPEGDVALGDRLITGQTYEVVLTTGSGFYRYRTGDLVDADQDGRGLRFVGRTGNVSDLVGEKLSEAQVARAFAEAGARGWAEASRSTYRIYLDGGSREVFEQCLCENPYLAQALELGQLDPFDYHFLAKGWEQDRIATIAREQQCRAGDVKLPVLLPYRG